MNNKEIADIYGVSINSLITYYPILANYRNLCAHEDLCYNNQTYKKIDHTKYHDFLNIPKDEENEYIYGVTDLFAVIIIMKQLLTKSEFRDFIYRGENYGNMDGTSAYSGQIA